MTLLAFEYGTNSHHSSRASSTSSGKAGIRAVLCKNTTSTRSAPQRHAADAQSKAVSPAPNTITLPDNFGSLLFLLIPCLDPPATQGRKVFDV